MLIWYLNLLCFLPFYFLYRLVLFAMHIFLCFHLNLTVACVNKNFISFVFKTDTAWPIDVLVFVQNASKMKTNLLYQNNYISFLKGAYWLYCRLAGDSRSFLFWVLFHLVETQSQTFLALVSREGRVTWGPHIQSLRPRLRRYRGPSVHMLLRRPKSVGGCYLSVRLRNVLAWQLTFYVKEAE